MVIQPGAAEGVQQLDLLTEEEYFDVLDRLPAGNQQLEDTDPDKFIAKMGAEAVYELLVRLDLDTLSYELRHRANTDGSQQRKTEALKRLQIVESFRASRGRQQARVDDFACGAGYSAGVAPVGSAGWRPFCHI